MVDCVTCIVCGQLGLDTGGETIPDVVGWARAVRSTRSSRTCRRPSVVFMVGRALALGRRAALATVVGNAGEPTVRLAMVAAGVGSIATESEPVFTATKVAGTVYLMVLGVGVVRDRRRRQSGLRTEGEPGRQARW
jgi:hypothetical protein